MHTSEINIVVYKHLYCSTVKLVYNDTLGASKICCYNQVVVVTRTFSTETIEYVPAMCVVVKKLMLNSDFLTKFDSTTNYFCTKMLFAFIVVPPIQSMCKER